MTDSRAALEERARYFLELFMEDVHEDHVVAIADFVEQESSSLKLLLSAMCRGKARLSNSNLPTLVIGEMTNCGRKAAYYQIELDSSGIPVLTEEILEALKAAK